MTSTPLQAVLVVLVLLPLTACATYDPHMAGAHPASQYEADLEGCRTSSREAVRLDNARFVWRWIGSAYRGPGEVRVAIRQCMEDKGYALAGR